MNKIFGLLPDLKFVSVFRKTFKCFCLQYMIMNHSLLKHFSFSDEFISLSWLIPIT